MRYKYFLMVLPWVVSLIWLATEAVLDSNSASREQSSTGTIIERTQNHGNYYHYRYVENGKEHEGWGNGDELIANGGKVMVFYDRANPDRSSLIHFAVRGMNDFGPIPLLCIFILGGVWVAVILRARDLKTRDVKSTH